MNPLILLKRFSFLSKTASQFDNTESIKGIPVGLLASETALISEPLRTVCMKVFKSWEAVFARKLMENGFAEEEANQLGTLINSMIEGGIMLSLTNKDKTPLLLIAEQIPVLVRKKGSILLSFLLQLYRTVYTNK